MSGLPTFKMTKVWQKYVWCTKYATLQNQKPTWQEPWRQLADRQLFQWGHFCRCAHQSADAPLQETSWLLKTAAIVLEHSPISWFYNTGHGFQNFKIRSWMEKQHQNLGLGQITWSVPSSSSSFSSASSSSSSSTLPSSSQSFSSTLELRYCSRDLSSEQLYEWGIGNNTSHHSTGYLKF